MKNLRMQKHWYLAALGLVGLWKLPHVWSYIAGNSTNIWDLVDLAWLGWFLYLIPETAPTKEEE